MQQAYLVIIAEAPETRVAFRFAASRALKTNRQVEVLAIQEPQDFVQWGGVQAAIEEEERLRAEAMIASQVGEIVESIGIKPVITIKQGNPIKVISEVISGREDIVALVLGAAPGEEPGPIVRHFTGAGAGDLPCPVLIVPGSLTDEQVENLS